MGACHEKVAEFEERKAQKKKQNYRKAKTKKSYDTASVANVDAKLQSLLLDIESEDNARSNAALKHDEDIPKKSEDTALSGQCAGSGLAHLASGLCVKNPTNQPSPIDSVDLTIESPVLDFESKYNARHKLTSCSSSSTSRISVEFDLTVSETFLDEEHEKNINNRPCVDSQSDLPSSMETDVVDLLSPSPLISTRYMSKCQGNVEQVTVIDLSDSDMEISPEHAQKARELRQFLTSIRKEIF